jgi:hypothetical protein
MIHRLFTLLNIIENTPQPEPAPGVQPAPTPTPEPEPVPDPEIPLEEKHYRDMTLAELKQVYGTRILVERIDGYRPGHGITTRDLMDRYYEVLHHPTAGHTIPDPVTYMSNTEEDLKNLAGHYSSWYPKYEIISYRGKSYKDSVLYKPEWIQNFNTLKFKDLSILPSNPVKQGEKMADIHTYSDKFAVYLHDNTTVGTFDELMYQANGTWMVDGKNLFKHFGTVTVNQSKVVIKYQSNTVELTVNSAQALANGISKTLPYKVEVKGTSVFVPIREVSDLLGLDTRVYEKGVGRIEVANFPLREDYK